MCPSAINKMGRGMSFGKEVLVLGRAATTRRSSRDGVLVEAVDNMKAHDEAISDPMEVEILQEVVWRRALTERQTCIHWLKLTLVARS